MKLTDEQGKKAVHIARRTVDTFVRGRGRYVPEEFPEIFKEKRGVFVTLQKYPGGELRGCIGFPEPVAQLIDALIDSAISAASRDPRFEPVREDELDGITVEVSVLTPPQLLKVKDTQDYPKRISIGRDGLIIRQGFASGLLLPQVPVEWGWDEEEFLSQTCWKAGLPPDAWLDPEAEIYSFQAQIWTEKTPRGEVVKKELDK